MSWQDVTVGDVLTLQRGFDITKAQQSDGPYPVVSSSGVNSYHAEFKCDGPGVVIGRKGTLGTAFFLEGAYWPHDTSLWVKDFKGNDPRFCYYLLKSLGLEKYDVGSSNPTLNRNHLHLLDTRAPAPSRQRRIADILSAYDDLIENNTQRIAILEDMARRLFEEWFIRFKFPGGNGEMPDDWCTGKFGNVATLRKSKAKPGEHLSGRHYVPIECIGRKTLALSERRPWQEAQSSLQTFERGDILFGAMRTYFHKVCIAPFAGITRSTCFVLVPNSSEIRAFATLLAFRDETVAYATTHSKGSTIPYAHWEGSLENMATVIPSHDVLTNFERLVSPMLETVVMMHETQHNLRTARDLLLPRLISGEIEVRTAEAELETTAA